MALYTSVKDIIGNTPLLQLDGEICGLKNISLYAKLEHLNPFGSIKDRTALGMMEPVLDEAVAKNKTFIEASSGNTIKAMQALAGIHGLSSTSVTNRIRLPETKDILRVMGASIIETPGKSSCIDPTNPDDPLYVIKDMIANDPDKYCYPNQYYNEHNPQIHHDTTGQEILNDLSQVDYLFGTLGTTGSTQGITKKLRTVHPDMVSIGVAAARDDYIPGIRSENDLMDVGIYDESIYSDILYQRSTFAIDGMIELIRKHGVLAGPTSGAIYYTALEYLRNIDAKVPAGTKLHAVIIICDRMEWYISYLKERRPEIFKLRPQKNSIKSFYVEDQNVQTIESNQLEGWITQYDPMIIDMRSNLAFKFGHIPGSINIVDTLLEDIVDNKDPFPKDKPLLFVCARGTASAKYAAYMSSRGYDSYNLQHGINSVDIALQRHV